MWEPKWVKKVTGKNESKRSKKHDIYIVHLGLEIATFRITTSYFCEQAESLNNDEIHSSLSVITNFFIMREI